MKKGKSADKQPSGAQAPVQAGSTDTFQAVSDRDAVASDVQDEGEGGSPALGVMGAGIKVEGGNAELSQGGKHAKPPQPLYIKKSKRTRKILIVLLILLILMLGAGAYLGYQLLQTAQTAATQQSQVQVSDVDSIDEADAAKDASTSVARKTSVPDLVQLLGLTAEQAVEVLQHGAQITSSVEVNEEGNPIKQEVRVALTAEPSDTRSGTPTIYLSIDEGGLIIQSGYSVATSSLGYGSLSFTDAIQNEHIIEKTLEEAGLTQELGSVALPDDKMQYSSYASDGTTLTRETYSFEGEGVAEDGATVPWNAILTYDYSTANATGNLADTIRTVYVYVSTMVLNAADIPEEVPAE